MNREEAIDLLDNLIGMVEDNHQSDYDTALQMALKALERESKKYERERHCDCCGVLLTEENNKCGYELCDSCNERLEQSMERESRNEQGRSN